MSLTAEAFAATLTATYGSVLTREQATIAKQNGLVVVYGHSDDLMEFEGAIYDELGADDGTTAYLTSDGLLKNDCENDDCPHFVNLKAKAATIEALWCAENGYSWTFSTDIPHATFEVTYEGSPYCRGIVFALAEVRTHSEPIPGSEAGIRSAALESELATALRWALAWIDAVPQNIELPAMPGFDRDYVNDLLSEHPPAKALASRIAGVDYCDNPYCKE